MTDHLSQLGVPKLTDAEAYERARLHDLRAQEMWTKAASYRAEAQRHQRWAAKWRDWADDDYGNVPYPGGDSS